MVFIEHFLEIILLWFSIDHLFVFHFSIPIILNILIFFIFVYGNLLCFEEYKNVIVKKKLLKFKTRALPVNSFYLPKIYFVQLGQFVFCKNMHGKNREQFLPTRNAYLSRYLLLKEQREHLLKLGQNGKHHDRKVTSTPQNRGIPKLKTCSSYVNDFVPNNNSTHNKKIITLKKKHFSLNENDRNSLEDCYRRICNDDVSSLKLLLQNRDHRFGKSRIPLLIKYPTGNRMKKCFENNNKKFPKKSPPYVPHSFVRSRRKRNKISTEFNTSLVGKVHIKNPTSVQQQKNLDKTLQESQKRICKDQQTKINSVLPSNSALTTAENFEDILSNIEKMSEESNDANIVSTATNEQFSKELHSNNSNNLNTNVPTKRIPNQSNQSFSYCNSTKSEISSSNCAISLEVLDENGDKGLVVWHEPESKEYAEENEHDNLLNESQTLAAQRKQELKELLEECSDIARQVNELELQQNE